MLLSETGAVQPKHAGPHEIYDADVEGMLMHDMLFTPFFCGAAGTGFPWHWDGTYIEKNNLWYHLQRFANAVKDTNPLQEQFIPEQFTVDNLRLYVLTGKGQVLVWCRDANNTWITELRNKISPSLLQGKKIDLISILKDKQLQNCEVYDPWTDKWIIPVVTEDEVYLPDFKRSLVLRFTIK